MKTSKRKKTPEVLFKPVKLNTEENIKNIKRKNLTWDQATIRYPKMKAFDDADRDGKLNVFDCKPLDSNRDGFMGDVFRGAKKTVSRVASVAKRAVSRQVSAGKKVASVAKQVVSKHVSVGKKVGSVARRAVTRHIPVKKRVQVQRRIPGAGPAGPLRKRVQRQVAVKTLPQTQAVKTLPQIQAVRAKPQIRHVTRRVQRQVSPQRKVVQRQVSPQRKVAQRQPAAGQVPIRLQRQVSPQAQRIKAEIKNRQALSNRQKAELYKAKREHYIAAKRQDNLYRNVIRKYGEDLEAANISEAEKVNYVKAQQRVLDAYNRLEKAENPNIYN